MKIEILSPTHYRTFDATAVELDTVIGNRIIQQGHAPTVLVLADRSVVLATLVDGKKETIVLKSGFAEVRRDGVRLLVDE